MFSDSLKSQPLSSYLVPSHPEVALATHTTNNHNTNIHPSTYYQANKSAFTASFLWIASKEALDHFNTFLLTLTTTQHANWDEYLRWLRPYACCKKDSGIAEDERGQGLRPMKINEMTILAFYHRQYVITLLCLCLCLCFCLCLFLDFQMFGCCLDV